MKLSEVRKLSNYEKNDGIKIVSGGKSLKLASNSGVPGATRTPDPLLRRQLLYPAELQGRILSGFPFRQLLAVKTTMECENLSCIYVSIAISAVNTCTACECKKAK